MSECVFCRRIGANDFDGSLGAAVHFEPLNPVTPGHRLFIPREHATPHDITGLSGITAAVSLLYAWRGDRSEDFNIIVNGGPDASQTIEHLHVHYVPRRRDDGLVLPWTGQDADGRTR